MKLEKHPFGVPYEYLPTHKKCWIVQVYQDGQVQVRSSNYIGIGSSWICHESQLKYWTELVKPKAEQDG